MSRSAVPASRIVEILIFDEVELLDVAGPYEAFSVAGFPRQQKLFEVSLVAERAGQVMARNRFAMTPHHTIDDCPEPAVLVIPGGFGTRREIHNSRLVQWISAMSARSGLTLSVCSGALLLARAGLLEGLHATTHQGALGLLAELAPNTTVHSDQRVVDNGRIVLSAGVSAGIDAALHVISRLEGLEVARETANYMEYRWVEGAGVNAL